MTPIDISKFEQLRASGDLPSPKGAALTIIRLTQKEDVPLNELAKVIGADPAFAGRLIKAANSAQAAGRRPVASISDALSVLGITTVRTLALGFSLLANYNQGKCEGFDYDRFWSHSLAHGLALQALMQRTRGAVADEAFCVGLLAGVGTLALATLFPTEYSQLLKASPGDGPATLFASEEKAFALNHGQLTAALLNDWGLPHVFSDPVLYYETPEQANFEEGSRALHLTMALALANHVADICLAPEAEWRAMMPKLFMLGARLSLDAEAMMAICDKVAKEWKEWGALLRVSAKDMPPFAEMSKLPLPPQVSDGLLLHGGQEGYRLRVLVVEDDPGTRLMLRKLLTDAGHEVHEAENGRQGLALALAIRPEMVITDWLMPEMTGPEMIRALRDSPEGRSVYIMILTILDQDDALVEGYECGADDFMIKPLNPRVLTARLRAGQRVVKLQHEVERDRDDMRRFAAELAVTNRKLQQVALTDFLTGFPNRRYAMARLQQDWAASTRSGQPLSCLVIDVDNFKQINDGHGHDVGDVVLKQAAQAIKTGLRLEDVVCRLGGDEFLAICPNTNLESAMVCAERVRQAVASLKVSAASGINCSVSIGVAQRGPAMARPDDLVKVADEGARLAKGKGRNCAVSVQLPSASAMGPSAST